MALNGSGLPLSGSPNNMTDGTIEEILLRLPLTSLARSKSLSKKWCDFISHNKYFHECYLSKNRGKCFLLLGFYFCKALPLGTSEPVRFLPTSSEGKCLKTLDKKRKMHSDAATSDFHYPLPLDQSLSFLGVDSVCLWGSSSGFLLSSLEDMVPMNYIICNPITKERFALPPPTIPCRWLNHGFICHETYRKVVRFSQHVVPEFRVNTLTIEIYSSESPQEWKPLPLMTFPFSFFVLQFPAIITEKEVIYLPVSLQNRNNALIIFDPTDKDCMEVLEFPAQSATGFVFKSEYLGQSDGLILYAQYEFGQVTVWQLNESIDGGITTRTWCLRQHGNLDMTRGRYRYNAAFYFIGFHPMNPQVLFIGADHKIFVFDVGCSKLELICDFAEHKLKSGYIYFPYTYGVIGPHMFCES